MRLWLQAIEIRNSKMQNGNGYVFCQSHVVISKMKILGANRWWVNDPKLDSIQRAFNGWWYRWRFVYTLWRNDDGNLYVPYANCNPNDRNLNANWVENDWDTNDASLLVRNCLHSSAICGSFVLSCRNQPPNILPISSNFSEIKAYLLLSKDFISHASLRKNFNKSTLIIAFLTVISLDSPF